MKATTESTGHERYTSLDAVRAHNDSPARPIQSADGRNLRSRNGRDDAAQHLERRTLSGARCLTASAPSTISTTPPDGHGGISSIPTHVQQHVDAAGRIHPGDGHSSADASASAGHLQSHGPASRPQTAHGDGSSIVTGPGVVARGTRTDAADVSPAIRSSLSPPHASVFTPSAHAAEALGRQRQKRSSGSPAGARRSAAAH